MILILHLRKLSQYWEKLEPVSLDFYWDILFIIQCLPVDQKYRQVFSFEVPGEILSSSDKKTIFYMKTFKRTIFLFNK